MGISVPVDMEHYKELKIISDRLGIGLKKTLEYLIKYYWKAEISKKGIIETKPVEDSMSAEKENQNEVLPDLKSASVHETSSKIPAFLERRIITHLPE